MCKDSETGEYGYSLLAWHERLLYPDEHAEAEREAAKDKPSQLAERLRSFLRV